MSEERILPHHLDNERAVLGSCLMQNEAVPIVRQHLKASDFYSTAHKIIFEAIVDLSEVEKGIDLITLVERIKVIGKLEAIGGPAYLAGLDQYVLSPGNVLQYCQTVKNKSLLRQLITNAEEIKEKSFKCVDEQETMLLIAECRSFLDNLVADMDFGEADWQDMGEPKFVAEMASRFIDEDKCEKPIDSYLLPINMASGGGYLKNEMSLILARPGGKKTRLATAEMRHMTKQGRHVAFFSMELTREMFWEYIIKQETGYVDPEFGKRISSQDIERIAEAHKRIQPQLQGNLYFKYDPGLTPSRIDISLAYLKAKHGVDVDVVIIDHFTRLFPNRRYGNQVKEDDEKAVELAALAGKFGAAFILIWHPPKHLWESAKLELSSGRGSGMLSISSKLMLTLSPLSDEEIETNRDEGINIPRLYDEKDEFIHLASAKSNRGGKLDYATLVYHWNRGELQTFEEYRHIHSYEMEDTRPQNEVGLPERNFQDGED